MCVCGCDPWGIGTNWVASARACVAWVGVCVMGSGMGIGAGHGAWLRGGSMGRLSGVWGAVVGRTRGRVGKGLLRTLHVLRVGTLLKQSVRKHSCKSCLALSCRDICHVLTIILCYCVWYLLLCYLSGIDKLLGTIKHAL